MHGSPGSLDMLFDNTRLLAKGVAAPPRFAPIASQMHYDFKGMPTRKRHAVKATAAFCAP
jgi:hypothetical protein